MHDIISVCTFNARGLNDSKNRRKVFTWLHNQKFSISLIQETYCIDASTSFWSNEWGGKAFFLVDL